jgi:SsrA-binding protein
MAVIIFNRKAKFDYEILETFQAGLALDGRMVKLVRARKVTLNSVFIIFQNNRLEMINFGNEEKNENVPLLLKPKEMKEIMGSIGEKGVSCIPLNIKTVGRWLKADIALVRGKKNYDKRQTIKKRDLDREEARGKI